MLLYFFFLLFAAASRLDILLIPPINLDLLDADPKRLLTEENLYAKLLAIHLQLSVIDLDNEQYDYSHFTKYELSQRSSLSAEKMRYMIDKNPNFVLYIKDSNTYIVPQDLSAKRGSPQYNYVEYWIYNVDVGYENVLLPASGCLSFSSEEGEGSVAFRTKVEVGISPKVVDSFSLSLGAAVGFSSSFAVSFSGALAVSHRCSTKKGVATRLFYKVQSALVQADRKVLTYNSKRSSLVESERESMQKQKFLTGAEPIYLCASEDKMDLKCDVFGDDIKEIDGDRSRLISKYYTI